MARLSRSGAGGAADIPFRHGFFGPGIGLGDMGLLLRSRALFRLVSPRLARALPSVKKSVRFRLFLSFSAPFPLHQGLFLSFSAFNRGRKGQIEPVATLFSGQEGQKTNFLTK